MKKFLRPLAVFLAGAFLVSCTSPYQAQMGALYGAYQRGEISQQEYERRMTDLRINDAGWQQNNANNVATGVAVGAVALGTAAILSDNHHHHGYYGPYYGGHRHRRHW